MTIAVPNYERNPELVALARALAGRKIESARVWDNGNQAWAALRLDNGSIIDIGASGSLHDECYLIFQDSNAYLPVTERGG